MKNTQTFFLLLIAAIGTAYLTGCGRDLEPLAPSAGVQSNSILADHIIVLEAKSARNLKAPFVLSSDVTTVSGAALVIAEGDGAASQEGRAQFDVSIPETGRYILWAHTRWNDECGNSLSVRFSDSLKNIVLQDALYKTWHWIRAGEFTLNRGRKTLILAEREDGIALDQILLTRNPEFIPAHGFRRAGIEELRRFSDDFTRSPNHGLGRWKPVSGEWEIVFAFDPNRIPDQYALTGRATNSSALAVVDTLPWKGCRLNLNVRPQENHTFGVILGRNQDMNPPLEVKFLSTPNGSQIQLAGAGIQESINIGDMIRPNQWHRITIEQWAWVLRVYVDDSLAVQRFDVRPLAGDIGLMLDSGAAVFDDIDITEIHWQADNGRNLKIPWQLDPGAEWYRSTASETRGILVGRNGAIVTECGNLRVEEVLIEEPADRQANCAVTAGALAPIHNAKPYRAFRLRNTREAGSKRLTLTAHTPEVRIRRIGIRYGRRPEVDFYRIGPYHFTQQTMADPSDYLDFTPEEIRQMETSGEIDKLRREQRYIPIVGQDNAGHNPWESRNPRNWRVRDGILTNTGSPVSLRHRQEVLGPLELRMKIRLPHPKSVAEVQLYANPGAGARVRISADKSALSSATVNQLYLQVPEESNWHQLVVSAREHTLRAQLDNQQPVQVPLTRGDGGQILLNAPVGRVEFDDIEFHLPRRHALGFLYAFDRREPDWWRSGTKWIDHGGVACAMASSWISLEAPAGRGMLWNKRRFSADITVAFHIQENTEWFGWKVTTSHVHHPYDNIVIALAPEENLHKGYRLEINSQDHSATVLYRNGKEVARVPQTEPFPIRYVGGHSPYRPRTSRIAFIKRGGNLRAIINGRPVLEYHDPTPIHTPVVGIGGHETRVNFCHIELLSPPQSSN